MWIPLILGFVAGILCLALAEIGIALFFVKRLIRPRHRPSQTSPPLQATPSISASHPRISLEEDMWIATFPTSTAKSDVIKYFAQRKKKDNMDTVPEIVRDRVHVKLENNMLTISFENVSESIDMRECSVYSVSAGKEISRKWVKKYPIMVESVSKGFSFGGSFVLLYLDTSWSKETWCQVLRAASRWTSNDNDWYIQCKKEFNEYTQGVNETYPDFWKPCNEVGKTEDESSRVTRNTESLSRRQRLWRKIVKNKPWRGTALFSKEGTGTLDAKTHLLEFRSSDVGIESLQSHPVREISTNHRASSSAVQLEHEKNDSSSTSARQLESMASQTIPVLDQGTLCWNIMFSRLFFDAYHSAAVRETCHRLVQKQLSKIAVPGYMTGINLTKIDLGTKPPFIHSMQAHRRCPDNIWSFDAAVEYNGGAYVKLETRLNVRDYLLQESDANHSTGSNFPADLLQKGLENIQTDLQTDTSEKGNNAGGSHSTIGGWKSVLARFADQVPITLTMRLVSLRGTLKVQIKPPPTDHIWFAFTSMPTIELKPEPSIGDHRITTAPVVAFISNKIKMLIEETLVLPNCEGIWIPWMFSENDDWIPQQDMPIALSTLGVGELGLREEHHINKEVSCKEDNQQNAISTTKYNLVPSSETDDVYIKSMSSLLTNKANSSSELVEPFLQNSTMTHDSDSSMHEAEASSSSSSSGRSLGQDEGAPDMKGKSSTRTKMITLGKKFTEKLDEKRRIVVEKVEKVREKYELPGKQT